ncbi:MAG: methyltransferase, partial [Chloroflexi bacterium]
MQNADLKAQVVLVETMLRALPVILTGQQSAVEIMFPNGSMHLVEGIYQHNATSDYFNDILATLVVTYLQERLTANSQARVRILEIGAGTGGTTSRVLQRLEPYQASIAEYCYSDISKAFLRHGQRAYGAERPYLTYQLFNVEKPLAEQGIKLGSYDLVIATNVMHATSNIRHTVRNAKATLKKHGLLLINEMTGTSLFSHLTFGLLEGWWAYEDAELRVLGCPALTAESWQAVLSSEGLEVISLSETTGISGNAAGTELARDIVPTTSQEAGQQVIVAESDGVVRQPPVRPVGSSGEQAPTLQAPDRRLLPKTEGASGTVASASPARTQENSSSQSLQHHLGPAGENTDEVLRQKSGSYLKDLVAKVLKLPSTKIDAAEPLINYGLDSILVLQLTEALRANMEQISSTLFFEYATIDALV